jgi:hypothetical protein
METVAAKQETQRIRIEQHSAIGMLWFAGSGFTIGWLHLAFWKAALALLAWPYYLGVAVGTHLPH